jgi:hypothetical protein
VAERRRPVRLRPDAGLAISATGGLLLLYLMFQGWFALRQVAPVPEDAVGVGIGRSFDAWVSFAWVDLLLLAVSVVSIGLLVAAFSGLRLPVKPGPVLVVLGAAAFLVVLFRIAFPPFEDAGRESAPFFALLCCLVIGGGGHLSYLLSKRRRSRAGSPPAAGSTAR